MKKIIITLLIIVAIAGLCACNNKALDDVEQEIAQTACAYIGETGKYTLELVGKDEIAWSEWDYYEYRLTINGKEYIVGVQRNEKTVHLVDIY